MAAVTQTQNAQTGRHLLGDVVMRTFNVSGATGSTLSTGMSNILFVDVQQSTDAGTISLITAISVNHVTGVITFTTGGGAMVNEVIQVMARVG
jgi:hypothetical protein